MRAKRVTQEEQYELIMHCRASGLSDYQWCMEQGIKPGTFYNWVRRLRQKGGPDIPAPGRKPQKQEVVRIDIPQDCGSRDAAHSQALSVLPTYDGLPACPMIEVVLSGAVIRIPAGVDLETLGQTIRLLKGLPC